MQYSPAVVSYSSSSSSLFSFLFLPFLLSPLPVMSAHASHQGSHQFETFRLPTRNERPSGYEQTNGWGRVSNMQSRRTHAARTYWPPAQGSCTLDRAQSCATKQSRHTTPHHTRPHHITHGTTPRFVGFAAQSQGQERGRGKGCCLLNYFAAPPPHACRCWCMYCVEAPLLSPRYKYTSFVLAGVLVVVAGHGLVVDP